MSEKRETYPRVSAPRFLHGQWVYKVKWVEGGEWKGPYRCPKDEVRSEREAERYAHAYVAALQAQGGGASERVAVAPNRGPTLRDLRDDWLKMRRADDRLASSTVDDNESHLDRHILPELGDVLVTDLDPPRLRAFARGLRKGRASYTVLNVAHTLSRMIEDAMAEGWTTIAANPMRHPAVRRELPRGRTRSGKVIVHLTRSQAEQLLTAPTTTEEWRVRYLLGLLAGLRDGEIAGLRWSHVRFDGEIPVIEVREAVVYKGPHGHASVSRLKTDMSERDVPMHALVASTLRAWKAQGWTRWVGRKPKDTDLVLPSSSGRAWRPPSAAILRDHLDAAKLPTKQEGFAITMHATRRSHVTWLTAAEVPEPIVKMIVGHAGSGVTGRHYTATELAAMKRAVDRLQLDLRFADLVAVPLAKVVGE